MNWEDILITLYLRVSKEFQAHLWVNCQRFSNGGYKRFSDEEVMTVYIFGLLYKHRELKAIHRYTKNPPAKLVSEFAKVCCLCPSRKSVVRGVSKFYSSTTGYQSSS